MYTAPVIHSRSAPSSPLARRLVGASVLLVALAVVVPWLAINAAVSAMVLGGQALGRGPRALIQAIDYAGVVALRR